MRLPAMFEAEDLIIEGFIQAAREQGELLSCRALAQHKWAQVLDSFPYYTDTIQSQLSYPPSYYSLPRYSTTLWNYSQMIKLTYSPVISVDAITYVGTDGQPHILHQDVNFILDRITEPARIFPIPGQYWPPVLYVPNGVQIDFTAGYDPYPAAVDTHSIGSPPPNPANQQISSTIVSGIPEMIIVGIMNLVAYWFNNRGSAGMIPESIAQIFLNNAVVDWSSMRG
jgi:hypothetical protein